uniref:Uncharacterized protein n=1 Tax=Lotharella globosa TaxID=91324 RepID=A0A7S4DWV6_9EUKA
MVFEPLDKSSTWEQTFSQLWGRPFETFLEMEEPIQHFASIYAQLSTTQLHCKLMVVWTPKTVSRARKRAGSFPFVGKFREVRAVKCTYVADAAELEIMLDNAGLRYVTEQVS